MTMTNTKHTPGRTIKTPRGKWVTPRQYLALHATYIARGADGFECSHGHFGCAAWERGPCENETRAALAKVDV
jgi:hypothetical protein